MSQAERLFRINHLCSLGQCLSAEVLLNDLGVSAATLERDIAHLRYRMNAPIVFGRERGGWRIDRSLAAVGTQYELPGLWLATSPNPLVFWFLRTICGWFPVDLSLRDELPSALVGRFVASADRPPP